VYGGLTDNGEHTVLRQVGRPDLPSFSRVDLRSFAELKNRDRDARHHFESSQLVYVLQIMQRLIENKDHKLWKRSTTKSKERQKEQMEWLSSEMVFQVEGEKRKQKGKKKKKV
jgi:hypothetical protein